MQGDISDSYKNIGQNSLFFQSKLPIIMKKILLLFIMAGLVTLTGCNSGGLGYAMDLQESLNERYEAEEINVQVRNSELIVTLVNSPLEDLSVEEKQEMALEI